MNHALDVFRDHTGKLFGLNVFGVITWVVESTNIIGLFAAMIGLAAGVMLVCIRWNDFMASGPVQWVKQKWEELSSGE